MVCPTFLNPWRLANVDDVSHDVYAKAVAHGDKRRLVSAIENTLRHIARLLHVAENLIDSEDTEQDTCC